MMIRLFLHTQFLDKVPREVKHMLQIKEQYIINDKGQPTSVIITKKNYDRLIEYIEELEDIAAYDKAKHERSKAVPWNKVKR